jgi:hypothetical protein
MTAIRVRQMENPGLEQWFNKTWRPSEIELVKINLK